MDTFNQPIQYPQQINPAPPAGSERAPSEGQPPKTSGWLKWVLIAIVIALLSSIATYLVLQSQKQPSLPAEVSTKAGSTPTPTPDETANWKTYNGQFVTFKYPNLWSPTVRELFGGAILEDVHLGIPAVTSDQSLGFSGVPLESAKPNDVLNEQAITIGGKSGFKWIRKGGNYVSYDYVTRGYKNEGVFDIHVIVASEDKNLEAQLDTLTKSVIFK